MRFVNSENTIFCNDDHLTEETNRKITITK